MAEQENGKTRFVAKIVTYIWMDAEDEGRAGEVAEKFREEIDAIDHPDMVSAELEYVTPDDEPDDDGDEGDPADEDPAPASGSGGVAKAGVV